MDAHSPEIVRKLSSFEPWFYDFDLGTYGKTQSKLPAYVRHIHTTRLAMLNAILDGRFKPEQIVNMSCLDIACHEGFFSIELAKRRFKRMVGIDVREESLEKARFVAELLGLTNTEFQQLNAEEVSPQVTGMADITLFLGLLYHLENPMLCLRRAASVTKELCILETQVIDDVDGETEWGSKEWKHKYQGVLALIDETSDFTANNPETGATPLAMCPSRKGLTKMLQHAGFPGVEFITPPADAYEQMARGKRIVCVASKH